jgi:hypothetical protein
VLFDQFQPGSPIATITGLCFVRFVHRDDHRSLFLISFSPVRPLRRSPVSLFDQFQPGSPAATITGLSF